MTEKKFRPGWYQNGVDHSVTIADVEKAYVEGRRVYEPGYLHPGWGSVAENKARILIDTLILRGHDQGMEVSVTAVVRACVSHWSEFRIFVRQHDRRCDISEEPSIGALVKYHGPAVWFSGRFDRLKLRRTG
jgi:hypothetical protein